MVVPYTMTYTPSAGDTILATHITTSNTEHINNNICTSIDDYSTDDTQFEKTKDPYPGGANSKPETLAEELETLRWQILGLTTRFDAAATKWQHDTGTSLFLPEKAAAGTDTAAYGQLWVKTATPNQLWFTDDAGTDWNISTPVGTWETLQTSTASTSASVDFTSLITTDYDYYKLVLEEITPDADGATLGIRFSTDNGSTWISTNTYVYNSGSFSGSGAASNSSGGTSVLNLNGGHTVGISSGETLAAVVDIFNPLSASTYARIAGYGVVKNALGSYASLFFGGQRTSVEVNDAFQLKMDTGNILSGTLTLYGLRK